LTERIRQNVIIPQVNEPLGLVDGKPVFPTTAWHQYFDGLWKRSGAFNDGLLEEIIRSFVETSENRAAIEAVTGLVRSLEALSQVNAEDARQALESAVAAANAARDTLRAETESTIAAALELIETQARVARETARAEAQAELAVALEDAFARLRRVEDNLRAEVQATISTLGELSRLDIVRRANVAPDVLTAERIEAVSSGSDLIAIEPNQPYLIWAGDKTIAAASRTLANARTALTSDGGLLFGVQKYERTASENIDQSGSDWRVIARLDLTGVKENAVFSLAGTKLTFVNPPLSGSPADGSYDFAIRVYIQNRTFANYAIGSVQTPPLTTDSSFVAEALIVVGVFSGTQDLLDNFQGQVARAGVRSLFLGTDTNTIYIYGQRSGVHTETLRVDSGTRAVATPIVNQDIV
jgi:hypothetical protein